MALWDELALDNDSLGLAVGVANGAEGPWEFALEALLKSNYGDQARPLIGRLLAGTGSVTSAEHGYAIFQLAAAAQADRAALEWIESPSPATEWVTLPQHSPFRAELTRFLDEFGHRAVYGTDYLNPRWIEDPTYILDQVRFVLANPQTAATRGAARPRAIASRSPSCHPFVSLITPSSLKKVVGSLPEPRGLRLLSSK